jgi:L-ascorbate metabolism protein UlaG (beta-lactamase superfamily)
MAGTGDDVTLTFGGTATMLLRLGAFTLLTDPNFLHRGQRARLGYGLRSKRLTEPALQPTQLPALDGILLSHMHGDHWDRIATKSLPKATPVVTTHEAARCLADRGFTATSDLAAWQTHELTRGSRCCATSARRC